MRGISRRFHVSILQSLSKSTWYPGSPSTGCGRGRLPQPLDPAQVVVIQMLFKGYPFLGYKRIVVNARREYTASFTDHRVYRIMQEYKL